MPSAAHLRTESKSQTADQPHSQDGSHHPFILLWCSGQSADWDLYKSPVSNFSYALSSALYSFHFSLGALFPGFLYLFQIFPHFSSSLSLPRPPPPLVLLVKEVSRMEKVEVFSLLLDMASLMHQMEKVTVPTSQESYEN